MSKIYSPKIITDSLVMCLDASQNTSYPAADLPVKNGLVMWMDAADDTTFSYSSGTSVSQWRDKSGNNSHVSQATSANQPSRSTTQNSRKIVTFDGTNDSLSTSISLDLSVTHTIFAIASQTTGTEDAGLVSINNSLNNGLTLHNGSTYYSYYGDGSKYATSSITTSTTYIFTKVFKGTSSTTRQVYLNGTSATTTGVIANSDASGVIRLGQQSTYLNGKIAEVIIFNRELTATELKQVHTYLGQKWGISNTDRSIVDLSNNNNNGLFGNATVANMPLYDFYNKGTLKFDGTNDYASGFGSSIVPTSTVQYTVSMWVYRTRNNVGYEELLSQWTSANSGNSFFFGFNNSNVRFTDNWSDVVVSGAGNTNIWMNLVGVYTVSNAFIYLNGVLVATRGSGFSYTGTGPLILGRQGELASEYFGGNISNVLIYNKALSATEVAQNYEAQKSKFANTIVQQGLVLNLDVGNIYSYAGAGTVWYDVSGNSYNGTLIGSPVYTSDNNGGIIFDSVAKYVTLPASGLAFGTGQFAIEAWVFSTAAVSYNHVYSSQSSNNVGFISLYYQNGYGFSVADLGNSAVRTATTHQTVVSQNTWYHVVGIRNASNQYIVYVNGVESTTNSTSSYPLTATAPQIASNPASNTERFTGTIASFRLYNTSLSAAQVLQNYNATKGRFGL